MEDIHIDWSAFGEVLVVSAATAIGVMVLFAFGSALLAGRDDSESESYQATGGSVVGPGVDASAKAVAAVCFAACAGVVLYGLYIIIS
jgi:hypothetical protein